MARRRHGPQIPSGSFGVARIDTGVKIDSRSQFRSDEVYLTTPRATGHGSQLLVDLGAFQLHPWIYDFALVDLWEGGHFRQAVEQAGRSVSGQTQAKSRRFDIADDKLIQDLLSDNEPKPGAPRLRFPGDQKTPTWGNRMRGARFFSQGCYAGIRNIAAHEQHVPWSKEHCLEYLAAFSILARWIDECELYRLD
ncbi:TIGR02391 family protein [Frankia sp. R43]|uniref:TIGR02391 family protein n=1 Tax=Frankia sp. R43 TaxID=269536 RepID=UPI00351062BB